MRVVFPAFVMLQPFLNARSRALLGAIAGCLLLVGLVPASAATKNDDNPNGNSPRILVLGDSLSAAHNIPQEQGWVNLLRERLHERLPGATVVNASVSGATTAAGLQVLPKHLEQHAPNWVILELGANDGLQGKPIPYITKNLQRLIELSQNAGANVVLVGVQLPPNYGVGYTRPFFNQYAELAQTYGLAYVPFILEGVAGNDDLMQEDGLHPTAEAQPKVLDNVWPTLENLLTVEQAAAGESENPRHQQPDNHEEGKET